MIFNMIGQGGGSQSFFGASTINSIVGQSSRSTLGPNGIPDAYKIPVTFTSFDSTYKVLSINKPYTTSPSRTVYTYNISTDVGNIRGMQTGNSATADRYGTVTVPQVIPTDLDWGSIGSEGYFVIGVTDDRDTNYIGRHAIFQGAKIRHGTVIAKDETTTACIVQLDNYGDTEIVVKDGNFTPVAGPYLVAIPVAWWLGE